jgi:hypothetical protein
MGADMTIAVCRDIHYSRGAKAWLDRTALADRGEQMARHAAIERMVTADRVARLDPLPDNYEDLFFWHDLYGDRADETDEPEFTPEEVRTMILDGVARIFEDLIWKAVTRTEGPIKVTKREERVVTYGDWHEAKAPHQHEKWQLQESAKGGMYCAACGEAVPS